MAKKAIDILKVYKNENGPDISTTNNRVIEKDGLYFKDIDGSGELKPFDDWRLSPSERAKALLDVLTTEEKLGQIFISDWRTAAKQDDKSKLDESGYLDEGNFKGKTIFGEQNLPSTSVLLKEWWARHLILRENPNPEDLTNYLNQLNAVAEECEHFVPVQVVSNSRNENGEVVFGMNDASGVFAAWPGTLGIAAAVRGDSLDIIDRFGECVRNQWNSAGLRKGYMYMADVITDPRWQRSYGTFGEDTKLVCDIFERLIPAIQGSDDGVTTDGVAMTVKHFPGGGARENGFDPHYSMGQWNVYATEGSLQKYHLPAFKTAIDKKVSSIMPYYSKPSKEKSKPQHSLNGSEVDMKPYGFAFNKYFIDDMLRNEMGFKGYINSDTGIVHNMRWGVEMLDEPERIGFAVNHVGVDLISGLFDVEYAKEALARATNDYYDTHDVPESFTKEQLVLTPEALDRAVLRTLTEMFALGMFENPYRDPANAKKVISDTESYWQESMDVHRKSVVLLKNDGTLPLQANKKVYIECFHK